MTSLIFIRESRILVLNLKYQLWLKIFNIFRGGYYYLRHIGIFIRGSLQQYTKFKINLWKITKIVVAQSITIHLWTTFYDGQQIISLKNYAILLNLNLLPFWKNSNVVGYYSIGLQRLLVYFYILL